MEIGEEFEEKQDADEDVKHLLHLVEEIVPFLTAHNAEPDACDLLIELEQVSSIIVNYL